MMDNPVAHATTLLASATHATLCPRRPLRRIAIRSAVRALTNYLVYSASECVRCGPAASARPPRLLPRRRSPLRRATLPLARRKDEKIKANIEDSGNRKT